MRKINIFICFALLFGFTQAQAKQYVKKPNVAQYGGSGWTTHLKSMKNTTVAACQKACNKMKKCSFISYNRVGMVLVDKKLPNGRVNISSKECNLFSGKPWYGSAPQADSYEKPAKKKPAYTKKPNVAQYGGSGWTTRLKSMKNTTVEACQKACNKMKKCSFISYNRVGMVLVDPKLPGGRVNIGSKECNLFSGKPWYGSAPQADSYEKPVKKKPAKKAVDVNAGPIWSQADAKNKCPNVCKKAKGAWTGHWRTTVQGKMSVCNCSVSVTGSK